MLIRQYTPRELAFRLGFYQSSQSGTSGPMIDRIAA